MDPAKRRQLSRIGLSVTAWACVVVAVVATFLQNWLAVVMSMAAMVGWSRAWGWSWRQSRRTKDNT